MFPLLDCRQRTRELMDAPDADPAQLHRSLGYLEAVNGWLGYRRNTLRAFERFSRRWRAGETVTILDIGTGAADLPRALIDWGEERGFRVRVVGVDLHPRTAAFASRSSNGAGTNSALQIVRADALALPFERGSFDYATCSLFLHHLDDDQVVEVMRTMNNFARRGVVIADLLRNRRAYAWITMFSMFANPMVRHDARASVAQGFTLVEAAQLGAQAGLDYVSIKRQFGHRFLLAGEKPKPRSN